MLKIAKALKNRKIVQIFIREEKYTNFSQMDKLLKTILILLLAIATTSSTNWDTWNLRVSTPGYVSSSPSFASSPPTTQAPYYFPWIRYKNTASPTLLTPLRKYQYMYIMNTSFPIIGANCQIYCGIRSFLVLDSYGNLVCQRDTSSDFWGSISGYGTYCVPNTNFASSCRSVMPSQALFSQNSVCNGIFSGNYQNKNYDCCFKTAQLTYSIANEVDFSATSSYTDLINTEP